MSSTGQATSSTSNVQLIVDALADYAKITGIDLSKDPFAAAIEQSTSPEAILQLLQGREKAFKDYRDGNRRLISCLSPAVRVLQAFSGVLGGAVSLVSHTYPSCEFLNLNETSSDPFFTSKCFASWDRCPPFCTSHEYALQTTVMCEYVRLPVVLHQATTPFSTSLSAWGISSSAWRSIRRSPLLR